MKTKDKGVAIIRGNERVLRARLADAQFFLEKDKQTAPDDFLPALRDVIFHEGLGTLYEKSERLAALAAFLQTEAGADGKPAFVDETSGNITEKTPDEIKNSPACTAARLAKADLTTAMVGEFPKLQGIMGGYYYAHFAAQNKQDAEITALTGRAIAEHYRPLGIGDAIPTTSAGQIVSLADKIDSLAGFWLIDKKPTGSRDPYALRRAALGIIHILLETKTSCHLRPVIKYALELYQKQQPAEIMAEKEADLLAFFIDRLKTYLRSERVIRHDIVDAVFATSGKYSDNISVLTMLAETLSGFINSESGQNLLQTYKRAYGICVLSDKADTDIDSPLILISHQNTGAAELADNIDSAAVNTDLLVAQEEKNLYAVLQETQSFDPEKWHTAQQYKTYLKNNLAILRQPVDAFFDAVKVNDEDTQKRQNRLNLLALLLEKMNKVAAFEHIRE